MLSKEKVWIFAFITSAGGFLHLALCFLIRQKGVYQSGPNHCEESCRIFFPKKKCHDFFVADWYYRCFARGFFVSFPKPEIPEFFSFHWRLSRTFNGCQDAQDDDCLLGQGGLGARPNQLSR